MASSAVNPGANAALDKRLVLWIGSAVLLIIVLVSMIAPTEATSDPRPSINNAGPAGAKAAYLTLEAMGVPVGKWSAPLEDLAGADAAHMTLVVADPNYTALTKDKLSAALNSFLQRGGRVLITGSDGALLLPGGEVKGTARLGQLCYTTPAGAGRLARAGSVEMAAPIVWSQTSATAFVEQRCGTEAVVVRLPVGTGEAVWWSSPSPLTNAELHNDADLKLLLGSIGTGRRVLFDESLQQEVRSQWSATHGLPLWWMLGQTAGVFLLMVFSFSRRRGPIRLPEGLPRSSPLEFAASMGDLYEKAGATAAATEAARRRLLRVLGREARLSEATLREGPGAIAKALTARFGSAWDEVQQHLEEAKDAADSELRMGAALKLVRALGEDADRVRRAAKPEEAPAILHDESGR